MDFLRITVRQISTETVKIIVSVLHIGENEFYILNGNIYTLMIMFFF